MESVNGQNEVFSFSSLLMFVSFCFVSYSWQLQERSLAAPPCTKSGQISWTMTTTLCTCATTSRWAWWSAAAGPMRKSTRETSARSSRWVRSWPFVLGKICSDDPLVLQRDCGQIILFLLLWEESLQCTHIKKKCKKNGESSENLILSTVGVCGWVKRSRKQGRRSWRQLIVMVDEEDGVLLWLIKILNLLCSMTSKLSVSRIHVYSLN